MSIECVVGIAMVLNPSILVYSANFMYIVPVLPDYPIYKKTMKRKKILHGLDRRYDVEKVSSVESAVLETFPYEYSGKDIVVDISTDEFTAVCPYSGLPDFATISLQYVPRKDIIELRSFKYYLFSYRNVGIYQEHVVNRILDDCVRCCRPKWMRVTADYRIRGGIRTVAHAEWGKKPACAVGLQPVGGGGE